MIRSQVLICGGTGCTSSGSKALIKEFEDRIAENGLADEVKVVRTGCFGLCALGPVVIVYPDGTFYSRVQKDDVKEIVSEVKKFGSGIKKIGDTNKNTVVFTESESFDPITFSNVEMGEGVIRFSVIPKENLFYRVLSDECGFEIKDDFALVSYIKDLAVAKVNYDKLKNALAEAEEGGYGIVVPSQEEFSLQEPEVVKQGNRYGVKIKASAPSLHIIKVDVETEVTPLVGTETQSQDLVNYLNEQFENNPEQIWETNLLGKSLSALVGDNISSKIVMMPQDAQRKMRKTLGRIINEGKGGVLCILL